MFNECPSMNPAAPNIFINKKSPSLKLSYAINKIAQFQLNWQHIAIVCVWLSDFDWCLLISCDFYFIFIFLTIICTTDCPLGIIKFTYLLNIAFASKIIVYWAISDPAMNRLNSKLSVLWAQDLYQNKHH